MTEIIIKRTEKNVHIKKSFIVSEWVAKQIENTIMDMARQERRHSAVDNYNWENEILNG